MLGSLTIPALLFTFRLRALAAEGSSSFKHQGAASRQLLSQVAALRRWTGSVGQIWSQRGRCLQALDPETNGGGVLERPCSAEEQGQRWAYNNATGQIQNLYGLCLEAPEPNISGSTVHTWACLPEQKNQQWIFNESSGQIRNYGGSCLEASEMGSDGRGIHVWSCVPGASSQWWGIGASDVEAGRQGALAAGLGSCQAPEEGDPCYDAVMWAKQVGIYERPEWYPELDGTSSFEDFQRLLYETGANDHICSEPCETELAPPNMTSAALHVPMCSDLPNVVLPCSEDRCKVLAKKMRGVSCNEYCLLSGRGCIASWRSRSRSCNVRSSLRCDEPADHHKVICHCGSAPSTTVSLATTTESVPTTTTVSAGTCQAVLNTLVGHVWETTWNTCGDRIAWLSSSKGGSLTEEEAKVKVSIEFEQCEPCWPWEKYKMQDDFRRSAKRGIAIQNHLLSPAGLASVTSIASWGYIWDFTPDDTWPEGGPGLAEWNAVGIRFVPMVWGEKKLGEAEHLTLKTIEGGSGRAVLLGFNEPNFQEQASLSPKRAAELWPRVEELAASYGIDYLVSPAVNFNEKDHPIDWLTDFLEYCSACKVDAIAFHSYTCHGKHLRDHINLYRVFGKPLWLTEFACSEEERLSAEGQMAYMQEAVPLLEHDPDVEMYAWFSYFQDQWTFPTGDLNGDAGLVYRNGTLSRLGELYGSFASTVPIDPPPRYALPPLSPTTTVGTTTASGFTLLQPDSCHTAVRGEECFSEVVWAMEEGIHMRPTWYPGLTPSSSFQDFQKLLHRNGHLNGVCSMPCETCQSARRGERCYTDIVRAMREGIHTHPEHYPGLTPSSSFDDFQAFFHRTGESKGACRQPCASSASPLPYNRQCWKTPAGCSSVGVNVFGSDGFENVTAMQAAVHQLFAKGIRHFRVVNVGKWQDEVLKAIDAAAVAFGVPQKVSVQLTSLFFESPATCASLPEWMDFSLTTTATKLMQLKNIGRFLVQLDTCSSCPSSSLHCLNPTEQAFGQDLRFGSTSTAKAASDFVRGTSADGYGPAHIVAAHQAFARNVEFVVPYMSDTQSPVTMVEWLVQTYIAPLRVQGRRFHLGGTFYPFWTSSEQAFAPFPAEQVRGFVGAALALGLDGFVVAETGWPEACPDADPAKTRPASLQHKCDYTASVLEEAEHLAQASLANGDGELLTYLWKFGPADDGSSCGKEGFGLFRANGSFACQDTLG